jgi:hypothetical protein
MRSSILKYSIPIIIFLTLGWVLNDIWDINKHRFIKPLDSDPYQSFQFFYFYFSTDSIYQKEHVKLPLEYSEWILEKSELIEKVNYTQWHYKEFPLAISPCLYDNHDRVLTGKKRLLEIDNTFYYFKFIEEDWYLVKIKKYI